MLQSLFCVLCIGEKTLGILLFAFGAGPRGSQRCVSFFAGDPSLGNGCIQVAQVFARCLATNGDTGNLIMQGCGPAFTFRQGNTQGLQFRVAFSTVGPNSRHELV